MQAHPLLHGHEEEAFGGAGYIGVDKRVEMKNKCVKWRVAAKRGKIEAMREGPLKDMVVALERTKAQIRSRVEYPFRVVKNLFGYRKVRCKWLAKNTAQLCSACVRACEPADCEKSAIASMGAIRHVHVRENERNEARFRV